MHSMKRRYGTLLHDLTTKPLVVFVPSPKFKGEKREEAIRDLAKRILGIDVGV